MKQYLGALKKPSRSLRKQMTPEEQLLWQSIRGKQIHAVQFYRQKPLLNYIVDFYAPSVNLVIEVDGSHHLTEATLAQDQERDAYLMAMGLTILRFTNQAIRYQLPLVITEISRNILEYKKNS